MSFPSFQSFRRQGTLRKVPHLARTPMTLTALLLIGLTALLRTKSKGPAPSVPDAIAPYGLTHPAPRPVEGPEPTKPKRPRGSRLGKILIALGVVLIAYSGAVIFWGDPATGLYARWKQHQLASALDNEYVAYVAALDLTPVAEERPQRRFRAGSALGPRSLPGPGPLRADVAPRGGPDDGDRRPPQDVRRLVSACRLAENRRSRFASPPVRDLLLSGLQAQDRR